MRYQPRGLYFSRASLRREVCVSKSIGLALQLEGNLPFFLCFTFYLRAISKYNTPGGAYIWRGDLTKGFLHYEFGGLIFGGAYFRNFTVSKLPMLTSNDVLNFCLFWRQTQERFSKGSVVHQTLAKTSAGYFSFFAQRAKNFPPFFYLFNCVKLSNAQTVVLFIVGQEVERINIKSSESPEYKITSTL